MTLSTIGHLEVRQISSLSIGDGSPAGTVPSPALCSLSGGGHHVCVYGCSPHSLAVAGMNKDSQSDEEHRLTMTEEMAGPHGAPTSTKAVGDNSQCSASLSHSEADLGFTHLDTEAQQQCATSPVIVR